MQIEYSPRFLKCYKKLPKEIKLLAEAKQEVFISDPYHPSLKTHKLSGDLESFLAFSVNFKYRIIFSYISEDVVRFHTVGGHEIYK